MPRRRNVVPVETELLEATGNVSINENATPQQQPQHFFFTAPEPPPKPVKFLCSEFLKNNYWDMAKECGKKLECPICLDEIDSKRLFCILPCGHYFGLDCLLKCDNCPLCRA